MAKSYSLVFIVLFLLTLGSCQSLEQIPIDYLQPADLSFPPQLRKVAIVNNTSDAPDNKLITETEKIKEGTPLISRATAYANGDPKAPLNHWQKKLHSRTTSMRWLSVILPYAPMINWPAKVH